MGSWSWEGSLRSPEEHMSENTQDMSKVAMLVPLLEESRLLQSLNLLQFFCHQCLRSLHYLLPQKDFTALLFLSGQKGDRRS